MRPVSTECEQDLRDASIRILADYADYMLFYLPESARHIVRVKHLITLYEDSLFSVRRRALMLSFLKPRRPSYYVLAARVQLGLARLSLFRRSPKVGVTTCKP